MKTTSTFSLLIGCGALIVPTFAAPSFTVHEWGTFTAVSASDGTLLSGLEVEEEALPGFVFSHAGFAPANKGWSRPVRGVTVKMETPVLYFYSDVERTVEVDVRFRGGSISQWYPDRAGGETLPPPPSASPGANGATTAVAPLDFAQGFEGAARWSVTVLAPQTRETINNPRAWETPHWSKARVASANLVRGAEGFIETGSADVTARGPAVEGFIFYRGIGRFELPLVVTDDASRGLVLRNRGEEPIPFAFVYDGSLPVRDSAIWWIGPIAAGAEQRVTMSGRRGDLTPRATLLEKTFPEALQRAGLTDEEARALVATWKVSYFERPGLRVFWIVPRAFTDRVLPIAITPAPDSLTRVLVGRTEVLTRRFEAELVKDFAADGGKRWEGDRHFRAYRERARQLGVVLAAEAP